VLLCTLLPTTAHAAHVQLYATLTPERLGHDTTIGFGFQITAPAGRVPPPLTRVEVRYPRNLGIALRAPNKKRVWDAVVVDGVYGETTGQ
jgi:hypothetical protein